MLRWPLQRGLLLPARVRGSDRRVPPRGARFITARAARACSRHNPGLRIVYPHRGGREWAPSHGRSAPTTRCSSSSHKAHLPPSLRQGTVPGSDYMTPSEKAARPPEKGTHSPWGYVGSTVNRALWRPQRLDADGTSVEGGMCACPPLRPTCRPHRVAGPPGGRGLTVAPPRNHGDVRSFSGDARLSEGESCSRDPGTVPLAKGLAVDVLVLEEEHRVVGAGSPCEGGPFAVHRGRGVDDRSPGLLREHCPRRSGC